MNRAATRARRRERWVQRAEKVRDAFGLVFVLVLTTYVLTSLLANHGWAAVMLTVRHQRHLGGRADQLARPSAAGPLARSRSRL